MEVDVRTGRERRRRKGGGRSPRWRGKKLIQGKKKTFGEKKKDFLHLKMDSKGRRADWQGEEEREKLRKVGVELS